MTPIKHKYHEYFPPISFTIFEHCYKCPVERYNNDNIDICSSDRLGKILYCDENDICNILLCNLNNHIVGKYPGIMIKSSRKKDFE